MMKSIFEYRFFYLLFLIFTYGCEHEPFPILEVTESIDDPVIDNSIPCNPDSVYFENEVLPFLISSCAQPGCHNAATAEDNVILNNYNNIINTGDIIPFDPENSELYETITDPDPDKIMPPPPEDPLSNEQISMIYYWILQGANNNYCTSCDSSEVTFSTVIYPLIELKCQGCHSGGEPEADLLLTSYGSISSIALDGRLYNSITGSNGAELMPFGASPLSACEINQIETWINEGAPDN